MQNENCFNLSVIKRNKKKTENKRNKYIQRTLRLITVKINITSYEGKYSFRAKRLLRVTCSFFTCTHTDCAPDKLSFTFVFMTKCPCVELSTENTFKTEHCKVLRFDIYQSPCT